MNLSIEGLINKHLTKPGKVFRSYYEHENVVYFLYRNRAGIVYTVTLDKNDWLCISHLPIHVGLVGKNKTVQATIKYNNEKYILARFILNAPIDLVVDHIDWNPLNNTRENIRLCTDSENAQNKRASSNNTSGTRGVSWSTYYGKWTVNVAHSEIRKCLGTFEDLEDAVRVLKDYKIKHMPYTPEARDYYANILTI